MVNQERSRQPRAVKNINSKLTFQFFNHGGQDINYYVVSSDSRICPPYILLCSANWVSAGTTPI
ncbi:MAG: hypothetical protein AAF298_11910 [Cyanobacteria bacterium P01_A01_bin.40]